MKEVNPVLVVRLCGGNLRGWPRYSGGGGGRGGILATRPPSRGVEAIAVGHFRSAGCRSRGRITRLPGHTRTAYAGWLKCSRPSQLEILSRAYSLCPGSWTRYGMPGHLHTADRKSVARVVFSGILIQTLN